MVGTKQKRLTETEPRSTVLRGKAEDTGNEGSEREVVPASEGEGGQHLHMLAEWKISF